MMKIKRPEITLEESDDKSYGKFVVEPLERGFGTTIGNSLRRILLSSLPGFAAVGIMIKGVDHEFSTIKGVKEEVTEIILNLKTVRFKVTGSLEGKEKIELHLFKDTVGEVTAGDIDLPSNVEVTNPDKVICTLDEGAELDMTIFVDEGRGYVPASKHKDSRIGYIAIDSIFTPVLKANFRIENTRVEQSIDFDKLTLEVTTDGTASAREIVSLAAKILNDHIRLFIDLVDGMADNSIIAGVEEPVVEPVLDKNIEELDFSVRTYNCLKRANIHNIRELIAKTELDMLNYKNLGKKSLDEIISKLAEFGLSLKSQED